MIPMYNVNTLRHSIEGCCSFKGKVQELINNEHLVFEEDNSDVKCGYHPGTMGQDADGYESFQSILQKLIKKEGPSMDGLTQRPGKEKSQKSPGPLKILYHKEKVRPMVDEMALFFGENAEITAGVATTPTSTNKEELGDKSKKDASYEEAKIEDFGEVCYC